MMKMKPIADPTLFSSAEARENVVIIDARNGTDARHRYELGHFEGALHVDLDKDLSQPGGNAANGGRHPLPPAQQFGSLLGRLGIRPETHVLVYDDKNGANAAARFWWMMKAAGHEKVQVLDGGMDTAVGAGIPLTTQPSEERPTSPYPIDHWLRPVVNITEVAAAGEDEGQLIVDVREGYRYRGESEPIDPVAGHIPAAVNMPYLENLDNDGRFLSPDVLRENYTTLIGDRPLRNVIVHCGSGVTACHTLLAMEHAGLEGAKLYVGSWSEWCRNERPIKTEV